MLDLSLTRPEAQIPDQNLRELYELCLSTPAGAIVEFGVYRGGSAWVLHQAAGARELHLFDTFTGLPFADAGEIPVGTFRDTSAEDVQAAIPSAIIHKGIFPGTLPADLQNLAFIHVDCDQRRSCEAAIELLWPRAVKGAIIAFDDYPFVGIKETVDKAFGSGLKFTANNIPYAVKE